MLQAAEFECPSRSVIIYLQVLAQQGNLLLQLADMAAQRFILCIKGCGPHAQC